MLSLLCGARGRILSIHLTYLPSPVTSDFGRCHRCRLRSILHSESMHELSIAASIVEAVTETAARYPGARIKEVRLRVGALASVVEDSLQFCWQLATEGSPLAASALIIHSLPVIVHCDACANDSQLDGVQSFRCPLCGNLASDLRQGRELEIESIELEDPDPAPTSAPQPLEEQI